MICRVPVCICIVGVENAADGAKSVGSDRLSRRGSSLGIVVHESEESSGAGRRREGDGASDEGGEATTRGEASTRGETRPWGKTSAEGGRVEGKMLGWLIAIGLWCGEHRGGKRTGAERVVCIPRIGSGIGRGRDGRERREDGPGRRAALSSGRAGGGVTGAGRVGIIGGIRGRRRAGVSLRRGIAQIGRGGTRGREGLLERVRLKVKVGAVLPDLQAGMGRRRARGRLAVWRHDARSPAKSLSDDEG